MAFLTFRPGYVAAAAIVFLVEAAIALWLRDRFIRPYVGDSLAVVLVYLGLRAVTRLHVRSAVVCALAVAVLVEFAQRFRAVELLGLSDSRLARVVIGTGFDPHDFAAYAGGAILVLLIEAARQRRRRMTAGQVTGRYPQ